MNKWLNKIDELLEKIPVHIRDIIQKISFAVAALLLLVGVAIGITQGVNDAVPAGVPLAESNKDLFYLDELRKENAEKTALIEDVEVDPLEFKSNRGQGSPEFESMAKDTMNHLIGEKKNQEMVMPEHQLRKRNDDVFTGDNNATLWSPEYRREDRPNLSQGNELILPEKSSTGNANKAGIETAKPQGREESNLLEEKDYNKMNTSPPRQTREPVEEKTETTKRDSSSGFKKENDLPGFLE